MDAEQERLEEEEQEKVPLFKTWGAWYALVIGFLVLVVLFFNFLTQHFS